MADKVFRLTDEKLKEMEKQLSAIYCVKGGKKMNSQEIVDYVMNTPHNTNPAILKQMIDANSSGSKISWNDLTDKPFEATMNGWKTADSGSYSFSNAPTDNKWNISVQLANFKIIADNQYKIVLKEPLTQQAVLETVCTGRIETNSVSGLKNHYLGSADDPIYGYAFGGGTIWSFPFTATHPYPTMKTWIVEIQEVAETIKPLAQKFLPESVVTQEKLDVYLNEMFERGAFSLIKSSTENSTKMFMLTVDDSGNITATEV